MLEHSFSPHPLISTVTFEKYLQNETYQNGKCVDDPRTIFFKYIWTISGLWNHFKGSCCRCLVTPWTVARQAPLSMEFSRQDYWSALPLPSPGIFPTWGLILVSCIAGRVFTVLATAAAAAAKSLQSCPILCNPIDGSHQAPPSLGFSRKEHWSGLPFPFPMHGSEKWKWSCSVMSDS